MDPVLFLTIIGVIAVIIILATIVAVIIILRQPNNGKAKPEKESQPTDEGQNPIPPPSDEGPEFEADEAPEAFLAAQKDELAEFELAQLSNNFRGVSQEQQRRGVITELNDANQGLIAFTSQIYNPSNAIIKAETVYGSMELIITQGKAGVRWNEEPLGVLDYSNLRILGPEGQLLGSMERSTPDDPSDEAGYYYPIGFYGQAAAEVITQISAASTLRWFGDQDVEQRAAYQNVIDDLEDVQTLLLVGALLLEFGYFSLLEA